jgi:hypothetical protein
LAPTILRPAIWIKALRNAVAIFPYHPPTLRTQLQMPDSRLPKLGSFSPRTAHLFRCLAIMEGVRPSEDSHSTDGSAPRSSSLALR